ncbi:MAG: site-specific integrase [Gordonia sp. (in: high G+C Gram-positive bacteria)]|uniref:tyrosine-type recombinase/integrase n=1 Tax=Gordonia sp. (in: high G+C Gram-positive bacteria) TaxID=84139 RepID=UPI0039E28C80
MSRRTNGEGTIYKRKDGRYSGSTYLTTATGRRRRVYVYGKTRQEAHDALVKLLNHASAGLPVADRAWSVGEYLDYWMANVASVGETALRPKTLEGYESTIRLHLRPYIGAIPLSRLSVSTLQRTFNEQIASGKTLNTVRNARKVLSAALTNAMREEIVTRNVARLVKLRAGKRSEIVPWTADEVTRFLDEAKDDPLYPAFYLLTLYGLRRGEVLGLRWQDIDWQGNHIHVRQQLQQIKNELQIGDIKTDAGERSIPLIPAAKDTLSQHRDTKKTAHEDNPPEMGDLVFLSSTGTPIWPRNFARRFHAIRERAGLRRIKLHHVRHSTATLLKNLGVADRDIQLILGHAHITTTQQIYQHGDSEGQREALDRIAQQLSGGDSTRSCQTLLSNSKTSIETPTLQKQNHPTQQRRDGLKFYGGPGGARTLDTLLKRSPGDGINSRFTSVVNQLRSHAYMQILGYVAVRLAVTESLPARYI